MLEKPSVIQLRLSSKEKEDYYTFPKGTMIWPENSGRGVLTQDLQAKRLPSNQKIEGLTGWQAEFPIHLYKEGKRWQLPAGTRFGAYFKNVRKKEL